MKLEKTKFLTETFKKDPCIILHPDLIWPIHKEYTFNKDELEILKVFAINNIPKWKSKISSKIPSKNWKYKYSS